MSKELMRAQIQTLCDALLLNGNTVKADMFRDHDTAQRARIQQLEARIVSLETDVDRMAWKTSPAMAQATIDQLVKRNEQLEARVKELAGQLPEGMTHCTILFKECPVGHGRLTAANWIPQECPWCLINSLKIRIRAALDSSPDSA